jgi:hypothetical protein
VKLAERSLPFFSILRGSTKVEWGPKQQKAFDILKQYLQHLPPLSSPEPRQPLILYVSTTHSVVSRSLVVEKDVVHKRAAMTQQYPTYFVSKVLAGSKSIILRSRKSAMSSL